jgi:plastocyanin
MSTRSLSMSLQCLAILSLMIPSHAFSATKFVNLTSRDKFKPAEISIPKDDAIKWTNQDDDEHTVTAYGRGWDKDVELEEEGDTTKRRFRHAGTFKYRCRYHSVLTDGKCTGMCGKVVVRPD